MTEDPYLIPGTGVLRNSRNITDAVQLAAYEANMTYARMWQLERGEVTIRGRWDLAHLMAHHRHIFGDVYPWAGEIRSVGIEKGTTVFCLPENIESAAGSIFGDLAKANHLRGLDRAEFVAGAAHVLVEVNVLHPAREGNGRAQRGFLRSLARQAGWDLDWSRVDPQRNIDASIAGYRGVGDSERPMAELLDDITTRLPPSHLDEADPFPRPSRGPSPAADRMRGPASRPGRDPHTSYRQNRPPGQRDFDR